MSGVRDAEPRDAAACAGVHVRSWKDTYRGVIPDDYLDALKAEDRLPVWEDWLSQPHDRGCVLVVEEDERVVGFGSFVADALSPQRALLAAIYLDPGAIGRGHGRVLMNAGLERLRRFGYEDVELWVHPENQRARRFYEAGGWTLEGTTKTETVWDVDVPEVRYVRSLRVS